MLKGVTKNKEKIQKQTNRKKQLEKIITNPETIL